MLSRALASTATLRTAQRCIHSVRVAPRQLQLAQGSQSRPPMFVQAVRFSSNKSLADEKIEEITELYATAKDEFEIAMEETEKATVYAEDDRAAAVEELGKVQKAYKDIIEGQDKDLAEEVKKRIGQRIRELEQGVKAMEELAMSQD